MNKYTINYVKKWDVEPRNGKHAYSVTFEEHQNEPVDYFSEKEPKVGDQVEGTVKPSEKGRPTFYFPYKLDRHQANIMSQWAVRLAAEQLTVPPVDSENPEAHVQYTEELRGWADIYLSIAMDLAEEKSE